MGKHDGGQGLIGAGVPVAPAQVGVNGREFGFGIGIRSRGERGRKVNVFVFRQGSEETGAVPGPGRLEEVGDAPGYVSGGDGTAVVEGGGVIGVGQGDPDAGGEEIGFGGLCGGCGPGSRKVGGTATGSASADGEGGGTGSGSGDLAGTVVAGRGYGEELPLKAGFDQGGKEGAVAGQAQGHANQLDVRPAEQEVKGAQQSEEVVAPAIGGDDTEPRPGGRGGEEKMADGSAVAAQIAGPTVAVEPSPPVHFVEVRDAVGEGRGDTGVEEGEGHGDELELGAEWVWVALWMVCVGGASVGVSGF